MLGGRQSAFFSLDSFLPTGLGLVVVGLVGLTGLAGLVGLGVGGLTPTKPRLPASFPFASIQRPVLGFLIFPGGQSFLGALFYLITNKINIKWIVYQSDTVLEL